MASHFFIELQQTAVAQAVAKSNHLVGAGLQIVHITGLLLLLASLVLIGLRVFNLGLRGQDLRVLVREVTRLFWSGVALAIGSGALIFLSSAARYADNAAFDLKVVLLAAALTVQAFAQWRLQASASAGASPVLRGAVTLSLVLWFSVAGAGRAIGFI